MTECECSAAFTGEYVGMPVHHWDRGYNTPGQKQKGRGDRVVYRYIATYLDAVGSDRLKVMDSHAPACMYSRRYRCWPRAPRPGLAFEPASQRRKRERRLHHNLPSLHTSRSGRRPDRPAIDVGTMLEETVV